MPGHKTFPPGEPPPPPSSGLLALIQPDPYVYLYSIAVPSSPATMYRLVSYPSALFFERDSTGAGVEYMPGSISHDDVQADTEGSIQKTSMHLQNLTREVIALLDFYDMVGQKVRIVLAKVADLPDAVPKSDETYEVLDWSATERECVLTLGRAALKDAKMPNRRAQRLYCAHKYGGAACGYDTTRSGALQACTKIEPGTNGCLAHGLDEAGAGLPNRHYAKEQRMLRFSGIPRTNGVGVSTT